GSLSLAGQTGLGVNITGTARSHDSYLTQELNRVSAESNQADTQYQLNARLDNLLSNSATGLTSYLNNLGAAADNVSLSPATSAERQVMLSEAQNLSAGFQTISKEISSLSQEANGRISDSVRDLNSLTGRVAELNNEIALASANGQTPNDLLDQRDALVQELAGKVSIQTLARGNGELDIFTRSGESLVQGGNSRELSTTLDPLRPERMLILNQDGANITADMGSGEIGGLLNFRTQVLEPARDELGRIATALAHEFNSQQNQGLDLDGNLGADLFSVPEPRVIDFNTNLGAGSINAAIANGSALTTSEYTLTSVDGANLYTLTRGSDGATFNIDTAGAPSFTTSAIDGVEFTINAGAATGDSFLIQPVQHAAQDISVTLTDPRGIAAASPVVGSVNAANVGSAGIDAIEISATTNLPLNAAPVGGDISLSFDAVNNEYTLIPDALLEGPLAYDPSTDAAGKSFSLLGGSMTITLSGTPAHGDELTLSHNANGSGDNRNALKLQQVLSDGLLDGGNTSIGDGYTGLMSQVGSKTQSSETSAATFGNMVSQMQSLRDGVSGVNLDEEAANLIKFQQAYRASAQVISAADDLFNTLIQVVGR
ncbi:MAG: flagellar hook-associated protein FlgK, partial [Gammaproteobacteria bacterium]